MNGEQKIVEEIQKKLKEIEEKEQIRIIYAVESGSRSWGFASPDSDYDVRFIYVRKMSDYLLLNPKPDTIEWQLDEVFDINGWDIRKALHLIHKSNSTVFEWSNSPVVYRTTREWEMVAWAAKPYFSVKSALYHYYGTAKSTCCQFLQEEQVKYKKYFYALRPLLSCRYIEEHRCPPPVCFDELMKVDMPGELRKGIEELLEKKKQTKEKEENPQIPVIRDFIVQELERQKNSIEHLEDDRNPDWEGLNQVFFQLIGLDENR